MSGIILDDCYYLIKIIFSIPCLLRLFSLAALDGPVSSSDLAFLLMGVLNLMITIISRFVKRSFFI